MADLPNYEAAYARPKADDLGWDDFGRGLPSGRMSALEPDPVLRTWMEW